MCSGEIGTRAASLGRMISLGHDAPEAAKDFAAQLMMDFAERTGVVGDAEPRRYLWTDAFAVCNLLGLGDAYDGGPYSELARRLVGSVHEVLGQHRSDSGQRGWLSGLSDEDGRAHPTAGGLRIGKPLPERGEGEAFDPELEWNRDGQYFHYLTRWIHALDLMTRWTGEPQFNAWARELADVSQRAFTYSTGGRQQMVWKMSIDLHRPLVPSMGHHDPLDGYVTCNWLQQTARKLAQPVPGPEMGNAISSFAAIMEGVSWTTSDPLGIGGLLVDAYRIARLRQEGATLGEVQLAHVLSSAATGLDTYVRGGELRWPASTRLAFRELGLAIGMQALERLQASEVRAPGTQALLNALRPFADLGQEIVRFWLEPSHRQTQSWLSHADINDVMLATCLAPSGYLADRAVPQAPLSASPDSSLQH